MRIVQINAVYGTGSTGTLVRDIHNALVAYGHESFVFWATAYKGDPDPSIRRIGGTVDHKLHALEMRLGSNQGFHSKSATKALIRELDNIRPDIIHLHNLHSNYIHLPTLLQYIATRDIPTLVTLHDCWYFTGLCNHYFEVGCEQWKTGCQQCQFVRFPLQRRRIKYIYDRKAELFGNIPHLAFNGVSRWTAATAANSLLSCAEIQTHIYNWVDTTVFHPRADAAERVRKRYDIPADKKILLGVSQGWSERKGLFEFYALEQVLADQAVIILVGGSDYIKTSSVLRAIGFTDSREELADLYSAADLFINPSRMETFGLVTAEAMACGTPVVAYDNTAASEIVPQDCGWLVEDGNCDAMTETVKLALSSPREDVRTACVRWITRNFSKDEQILKYIELYKAGIRHG